MPTTCASISYCRDMLALLSKVGQLYVQDFPDGPTLAAVDRFETLTAELSTRIWQKLDLLVKANPSSSARSLD